MKHLLAIILWFNRKAKNLSIRLVKWTGKSAEAIHPKHLVQNKSHYWFVDHINSSDHVLDFGCGGGAHAFVAASKAALVTGYDYSERNLEIARKLTNEKKIVNVAFQYADLEKPLPIASNSADSILALDVLEHLNHRDEFMGELNRILKPGKKLLISIPNVETSCKQVLKKYGLFYYSDSDHKYEYSKEEACGLFERFGFQLVSCDPVVLDTFWVGLIDLIGGVSVSLYKDLVQWKFKMAKKFPKESTGFRMVAIKK